VLEREIEHLYNSYVSGAASALPALQVTYGRNAEWQAETFDAAGGWRENSRFRDSLDFWRDQLAGVEPQRYEQVGQTAPGERSTSLVTATLTRDDAAALVALARSERCSLFTVLLACFSVVVWRRSGRPDVAVPIPYAGRDRRGLDRVVGLLLDVTLFRCPMAEDEDFLSHLRQTRRILHDTLAHQDVPFAELAGQVPELATFMLESDFVGIDLMDPSRTPGFAGLDVTRRDQLDDGFAGSPLRINIDFLLIAQPRDDGTLVLGAAYGSTRFDSDWASSFLDDYLRTAEAVARDGHTPLALLASPAEEVGR